MLLLSLFNTHTHAQKLKDINNEKMPKFSLDAFTEKMDTIIFRTEAYHKVRGGKIQS